jgi:hypothetical protein
MALRASPRGRIPPFINIVSMLMTPYQWHSLGSGSPTDPGERRLFPRGQVEADGETFRHSNRRAKFLPGHATSLDGRKKKNSSSRLILFPTVCKSEPEALAISIRPPPEPIGRATPRHPALGGGILLGRFPAKDPAGFARDGADRCFGVAEAPGRFFGQGSAGGYWQEQTAGTRSKTVPGSARWPRSKSLIPAAPLPSVGKLDRGPRQAQITDHQVALAVLDLKRKPTVFQGSPTMFPIFGHLQPLGSAPATC